MPASFSSDLSPVPSTPSTGYTQRHPSTPEGHAQSADMFVTPRAQHPEQCTDASQEGWPRTRPTPQVGNPATALSAAASGLDDPFEFRSEGTGLGLTRNLARRLDDGVAVYAATAMGTEPDCDASPTPAGQPKAKTEIRKKRLASQTQWDDQTTQMIGKIFRAIFRLEDRVERMANDVAIVKEQTEYTASRVRYEFHTEATAEHSGVGTPPPAPCTPQGGL